METAFPSGEWGEELTEEDGPQGTAGRGETVEDSEYCAPLGKSIEPQSSSVSPSLTIIGGTKYDEDELFLFLSSCDEHYVVGAGRGAESEIAKTYMEGEFTVVPLEPDVYGKNARKVNVEQVLSWDPTSPLLLVGSGERVKQAEAWLKRANWPREVHRIG